jgi:ribosome-associated heat shock protein Hsp15
METVRIDKYLWAIRQYKTRNKAAEACKSGKVKLNDQSVKPSKDVHSGDEIEITIDIIRKKIKVTGLIENRVSASLAVEYYEDLTPEEEYDKLRKKHEVNMEWRDKGLGRPTKKDRRRIDWLKKKY